ncbi:helical hairpin domain-containing protein, partial [Streptococcus suis]
AKQNGEVLITKNPHISSMQELVKEYNFLVQHGVTDGEQFSHLEERFNQKIADVDKELKRLDSRLARYHKIEGALLALEKTPENTLSALQLLDEMGLPKDISLSDISQLIQQYDIEKGALQEFFDDTLREYTNYRELQDVVRVREQTHKAMSDEKIL